MLHVVSPKTYSSCWTWLRYSSFWCYKTTVQSQRDTPRHTITTAKARARACHSVCISRWHVAQAEPRGWAGSLSLGAARSSAGLMQGEWSSSAQAGGHTVAQHLKCVQFVTLWVPFASSAHYSTWCGVQCCESWSGANGEAAGSGARGRLAFLGARCQPRERTVAVASKTLLMADDHRETLEPPTTPTTQTR